MRTIRITRQGFSDMGMMSYMRFIIFALSKKYNVVIDADNPDLVVQSNLSSGGYDHYLHRATPTYDILTNPDKKFLFLSGEIADFGSVVNYADNSWAIGYSPLNHPRYLHQPSCVIDVWNLFDEARLTDCPFCWLTDPRPYDLIRNRNAGFCSVVQTSTHEYRQMVFDKLNKHKQVTSAGAWNQNTDAINKYQWQSTDYIVRIDGLTYREKIGFMSAYKFNMAMHYIDTPNCIQEKIFHAYASGSIPIFHGNANILHDRFNPKAFINLHDYANLDDAITQIVTIDTNEDIREDYIRQPIFVDNTPPVWMNVEYTANFLEKVMES